MPCHCSHFCDGSKACFVACTRRPDCAALQQGVKSLPAGAAAVLGDTRRTLSLRGTMAWCAASTLDVVPSSSSQESSSKLL